MIRTALICCALLLVACGGERYPTVESQGVKITDEQRITVSSDLRKQIVQKGAHGIVRDAVNSIEVTVNDISFVSAHADERGDILFTYKLSGKAVYDDVKQRRFVAPFTATGSGRWYRKGDGSSTVVYEQRIRDVQKNHVKAKTPGA